MDTNGDAKKRRFVVGRAVPQGSTLNLSLYNLFMHEFAERVRAGSRKVAVVPAAVFADEVLTTANSPTGLQKLLTYLSSDRHITWNSKAWISEVLLSTETRRHILILSGSPL